MLYVPAVGYTGFTTLIVGFPAVPPRVHDTAVAPGGPESVHESGAQPEVGVIVIWARIVKERQVSNRKIKLTHFNLGICVIFLFLDNEHIQLNITKN